MKYAWSGKGKNIFLACLARAGFFIGAVIGILNFNFVGNGNIWQLWSCIPLALALHFGSWKSWRLPALLLTLLFAWGGIASCVRDIKLAGNLKMMQSMYHNRTGFEKSDLYTGAKISILDKKDLVNINFKDWLVLSMCAIWNSGIEVIYAKDRIGKKNYPNAWYHAMHSFVLHPYLPKLVNE